MSEMYKNIFNTTNNVFQRCNYGIDCYSKNCKFKHPKGRNGKLLKNFISYNIENNPNFRTSLCSTYQNNGECEFGDYCRFVHSSQELR